jgi:uncharacterized protein YbaP (TraB family)
MKGATPRRVVVLLLVVAALVLPARAQQPSRNFIWKITKDQRAIYLVGSVHLLTKDFYPLSPALDASFKDSDLLVEEANLDDLLSPTSQALLLQRGLLPGGQTVDKVVAPATYQLVVQRIAALGMPLEPLKRFKPWMLAITLEEFEWQKAGFDAMLGLDRHFHDRARVDGKLIQGLETVDFQISLFDQMSAEDQDRMLAETLKNVDSERTNIQKLTEAWKAGDAATVEKIALDDVKSDPAMYDRLLVSRNRAWMPKIEILFSRPAPAFVVVGAAHLIGPDGLLAMLKARGYQVSQL